MCLAHTLLYQVELDARILGVVMTSYRAHLTVAASVLVALLSGCGAFGNSMTGSAHPIDNVGFMDLWGVYSNCQAGSDVEKLRDDSSRLSRAAQTPSQDTGFVLPLPGNMERWVAVPSARLAVDVRAMAAACMLHAGQVAQQVGRNDIAQEMFQSVLAIHNDPAYEYYLDQARNGLAEVEIGLQASLPRR